MGCSGSFPGPESPASCYLVEADGYRMLLDLGNGALGYLARYADINRVDAVLLSHLHPDHCFDLCSMYVARTYHPAAPLPKVVVYGPHGTADRIAAAQAVGSVKPLSDVYDFVEWQVGTAYDVGPFQVSVARVPHPVPAFAMRVSHDEKVLVYSGDTGPCDPLVEVARRADLFLCEASFRADRHDNALDVHLTGREAGEHAQRAGVKRLVITHVPPWFEPADLVAEAREAFAGPIDAATSGAQFDI